MFKKIILSALLVTGMLYASGYDLTRVKDGFRGWSAGHAPSTNGGPRSDWGARR